MWKMKYLVEWPIWLQFVGLFLFAVPEINAKRPRKLPCGKLLQNVRLPANTKLAPKQRKAGRLTLRCKEGYFFEKGKNIQDVTCTNLRINHVPKCRGCGPPPSIENGEVRYSTTSVGSVVTYHCNPGFSFTGSRTRRKCRTNLRWSGGKSIISCQDFSGCGKSPFKPFDARARIVGGEVTDGRNWPWAVKVFVHGKEVCGGSLINKEFVLTAATCLHRLTSLTPSDVQVVFQGKNPKVYTSLALHIHPHYDPRTFINDIALIKIPKLKYFGGNQHAICIPRGVNNTRIIKDGNNLYVVGWGTTKPLKPSQSTPSKKSKQLKQIKISFMTNNICADYIKNKTAQGMKDWYFNSTTQFCAADTTGKNDTCQGDSGGPAMVLLLNPVNSRWRWFQIGITSWGYGCAQLNEFGIFTKVSAFIEWIDNIIKS